MKNQTNYLSKLTSIFLAFFFLSCQNESLIPDKTLEHDNFTLQNFKDENVRNHLQVNWKESLAISITNQDYLIFSASLDTEQEIDRGGFLKAYQYFIVQSLNNDAYFVMRSHTRQDSPTSNPFDNSYLGNSTLYDLTGEVKLFLALINDTLQFITLEDAIASKELKPTKDISARVPDCYETSYLIITVDHYKHWYMWDPYINAYVKFAIDYLGQTLEYVYETVPCSSSNYNEEQYLIQKTSQYLSFAEGVNYWEDRIDDSQLKPCMQTIMADLKNLTQGVGQIVTKFAGNTPGYNWTTVDGTLPKNTNATTSQQYNSTTGTVTTTFDTNKFGNASDLSVARTMLHESVHAFIVASFGSNYSAARITFSDFMKDYSSIKYPTRNDTDHAEFVRNYVNDIATALQEYGNNLGYNLNSQFYNDLAWGGLTHWTKRDSQGNPVLDSQGNKIFEETPWFKSRYPNQTDRNRVLNTINNEQGNNGATNQKGNNAGC